MKNIQIEAKITAIEESVSARTCTNALLTFRSWLPWSFEITYKFTKRPINATINIVTLSIGFGRLSELEFSLAKVKCAALILAPEFKTSDYIGMVQTLVPEMADAVEEKSPVHGCRLCAM